MLKSCQGYFNITEYGCTTNSTTTSTIFELMNCDWCNFWVSEWGNELWLIYNKNDINSIKENSMCMDACELLNSNLNIVKKKTVNVYKVFIYQFL